jgi:hypothetical protein
LLRRGAEDVVQGAAIERFLDEDPLHDETRRRWRHLDLARMEPHLRYRIARVDRTQCGVLTELRRAGVGKTVLTMWASLIVRGRRFCSTFVSDSKEDPCATA